MTNLILSTMTIKSCSKPGTTANSLWYLIRYTCSKSVGSAYYHVINTHLDGAWSLWIAHISFNWREDILPNKMLRASTRSRHHRSSTLLMPDKKGIPMTSCTHCRTTPRCSNIFNMESSIHATLELFDDQVTCVPIITWNPLSIHHLDCIKNVS